VNVVGGLSYGSAGAYIGFHVISRPTAADHSRQKNVCKAVSAWETGLAAYVYTKLQQKGCYSLQATGTITSKSDRWSCGLLQGLYNCSSKSC
jgi:hypothetical protein